MTRVSWPPISPRSRVNFVPLVTIWSLRIPGDFLLGSINGTGYPDVDISHDPTVLMGRMLRAAG